MSGWRPQLENTDKVHGPSAPSEHASDHAERKMPERVLHTDSFVGATGRKSRQ